MTTTTDPNQRSHNVQPQELSVAISQLQQKIQQRGDLTYISVEQQLQLLSELAAFPFGQFLIQHQGVNGYWTNYFLTYPWFGEKTGLNSEGKPLSKLEKFLLTQAPVILATQQRFQIFLAENQKVVRNAAKLASIPGGLLGELLYLDYTGVDDIQLIGIDLDPQALKDADRLAEQQHLRQWVHLLEKDAWLLQINNEFNLISSNGLTIYEPDDDKVLALYREFYSALTAKGILVTSFLTFPPNAATQCEWDMSKIDPAAALLQKIIFADIVGVKFQCYRSIEQTRQQLTAAGFSNIRFIYDQAKIFPTVVAEKQL